MRNVVRFFVVNEWGNSPQSEAGMPQIILLPSAPVVTDSLDGDAVE
jgi:hypothetical protein